MKSKQEIARGLRNAFARTATLCLVLGTLGLPTSLAAQGGPNPATQQAIRALTSVLEGEGSRGVERFMDDWLSPQYRAELGDGALPYFERLREATAGSLGGNMGLNRAADGSVLLSLSIARAVRLRLQFDEEGARFSRIETIAEGDGAGDDGASAVGERLRAVEELTVDAAALQAFRDRHILDDANAEISDDLLSSIAAAAMSAGMVGLDRDGDDYIIRFRTGSGATTVRVGLTDEAPHLIRALSVDP